MKFYLIPAYEETIKNQGYSKIISAAEKKGYSVEVLDIQIQNSNFQNLINQNVENILSNFQPDAAVFGFSTGALIAYQISTKVKFAKAFFCSISPLLENDIPKSDAQYKKYFGKDTVKTLKAATYGKSLTKKSFFFVGDSEGIKLPHRAKVLCEKSKGELIIIDNNDHELTANYLNQVLSKL